MPARTRCQGDGTHREGRWPVVVLRVSAASQLHRRRQVIRELRAVVIALVTLLSGQLDQLCAGERLFGWSDCEVLLVGQSRVRGRSGRSRQH